jgi:osmotically-inducible protein OsmY
MSAVMLSSALLPDSVAHTELPKSENKSAVARQVRLRLRRCGYAEMRRVEVSIVGNVLRLSGSVYSYHMKQLAQEVARQTVPEASIENDLTVVSAPRLTPK